MAGLTAGFTAAMWAFPDSTASGCQDVVCGSPESEGNYALGSIGIASGPALASVPTGSSAAAGPVTYPAPAPPPRRRTAMPGRTPVHSREAAGVAGAPGVDHPGGA